MLPIAGLAQSASASLRDRLGARTARLILLPRDRRNSRQNGQPLRSFTADDGVFAVTDPYMGDNAFRRIRRGAIEENGWDAATAEHPLRGKSLRKA